MVRHLEGLRRIEVDGAVVIVSHAEPIRAALLHYARIPLDNFLSVDIAPASVSTLAVATSGIRISRINEQVPA